MNKKLLIPVAGTAAVLGAAALLFVKGFYRAEHPEADISIGRVLLSELEEQKLEDVEAQIHEIQSVREEAARAQREAEEAALRAQHEAEAAAQAAADEAARQAYFEQWCAEANAMADAEQFKGIFSGSVVIGDSIVNGIIQTDLMLPSSVVSEIGANLDDLMEMIPEIQSRNPQNIFLYCGFNDIGMCRGDTEQYYSKFAAFIQQLQAVCPGVPIYVNHLIHPIHLESLAFEGYDNVQEYNAMITQLCGEYGLTLIENYDLVKEEFYYKDGYHMIYPFYPLWLRRMAEISGLM
ncbi:MAG: GDSL-type esterase/lipase family protein [Lachnospiraceae bacterium]|nr:GDSL-type esterase/lipase family protein [Lachnospiraceae bacterium]